MKKTLVTLAISALALTGAGTAYAAGVQTPVEDVTSQTSTPDAPEQVVAPVEAVTAPEQVTEAPADAVAPADAPETPEAPAVVADAPEQVTAPANSAPAEAVAPDNTQALQSAPVAPVVAPEQVAPAPAPYVYTYTPDVVTEQVQTPATPAVIPGASIPGGVAVQAPEQGTTNPIEGGPYWGK